MGSKGTHSVSFKPFHIQYFFCYPCMVMSDNFFIYSCMDKINRPIGNYKQVGQKKDMDCLCARNSKSLQCDGQGSYTEFQTFQDIKYCVDQDGFRKTRQYSLSDDRQCRIPKCECAFGDTVEGCTPDTTEACRVCDPITTYCYECEECEETDCN